MARCPCVLLLLSGVNIAESIKRLRIILGLVKLQAQEGQDDTKVMST